MEKLTGILLCGGKSRRMGTDKALLELGNSPMYAYPLSILQQWCSEILISANDTKLDFLGYPIVCDEFKEIGPMGGLYSCLRQSTCNYNLVFACDMPLINGALVKKMAQAIHRGYDVIAPTLNHHPEPLYALYHKNMAQKIEQSIRAESYSLTQLLATVNVYYIEAGATEATELFNANTPGEIITYGRITGKSIP